MTAHLTRTSPTRPDRLAPGRWTVEPSSTCVEFTARDLLGRPVVGTVPLLAGSVDVDADGRPQAVRAELDATGVDTGHPRRDADLQKRRFLHTAAAPVLSVRSGPARPTEDGWELDAVLSVRGGECPLRLLVQDVGTTAAGRVVTATTVLDRRDAGITVPAVLVRRQVELRVRAELLPPR